MSALIPRPISINDLNSEETQVIKNVADAIGEAFGPGGPGLLLVNGLRESFKLERDQLLTSGRALGELPIEKLELLEFPEVDYVIGWSCGRELFRGVVDTRKGSFYANPVYEDPSLGDSSLLAQYPHYMHRNHWPTEQSCALLQSRFRSIGTYINDIGIIVAQHCDRYVRQRLGAGKHFVSIEKTVRESQAVKGRLLHYFAVDDSCKEKKESKQDSWCGFHNDHGTLTGLVSASYFAEGAQNALPNSPDKTAGLYVARTAGGEPEKVDIPADCLAFQIGEAAQIASGGILRATPHAVSAASNRHISRVTLAVFLQPNPWDALPMPPLTEHDHQRALETIWRVPELRERYSPADTFHDFALRTFKAYHKPA